MKLSTRAALATATLGAILAAPLGAQAASSAAHRYQLTTRIVEHAPGVGEYDGALQLNVNADGIVNGYYRPDNGRFVPVTGGVSGDSLWLDIGSFGPSALHFTGTFRNGRITADAFVGNHNLELLGRPQNH